MQTPQLRLTQGKSKRSLVPLEGRVTIGRLGAVEVPIADSKASREHARVFEQGGDWHVVDLSSTNGTLVNGSKITRRALRHGDEITIGTTVFVFEAPEPAPAAPSAPAAPAAPPTPEIRAVPKPEPKPAEPFSPAGSFTPDEIVVKQRSIHYHRIEGGKKVNPLREDVSQRGGLFKLLLIAGALVVAIILFILALNMGQMLVGDEDEEMPDEPGIETTE